MEIEVNTGRMRSYAGKELEVKGKLEGVCTSLQICQRNLRTELSSAASLSVDRALSRTYSNLVELAGKLGQMSDVMSTVSEIYENTEDGIEAGKPAKENIEKAKDFNLKLDLEKESAAKKASDGLSWLKKLLSAANHSGENDKLGFLSSFFGVLSSLCNLYDSDSEAKWWSNLAGYTGSSLSLGGKLFKILRPLAEKYGSVEMIESLKGIEKGSIPEELKTFGTAGDIFSFSSAFLNAYYKGSDSVADFLQQCPGVISSGKNLLLDIKKFASAVKEDERIKKAIAPVVALINMGAYATGEVMKLSGDGHSLTVDEVADLLTDTGLVGAKSLLSDYTHGIVNVDTKSFSERFKKNQDAFLDEVMNLNISNQGKTLLVGATSPFIAAGLFGMTVQETAGNFFGNIYRSVRSAWAY